MCDMERFSVICEAGTIVVPLFNCNSSAKFSVICEAGTIVVPLFNFNSSANIMQNILHAAKIKYNWTSCGTKCMATI